MKYITVILFSIFCLPALAQVSGQITTLSNEALPYASVTVAGTYNGTSANERGNYTLNIKKTGSYVFIFQTIGFKTKEVKAEITKLPYTLDVSLEKEDIKLDEVVINGNDNPANDIILKTIKGRRANAAKTAQYTADFYSKGLFRLSDVPKKFLWFKLGDLQPILDPSGSGLLYLSETKSEIEVKKPNKLHEQVIASKVSGSDNGYSFNTAASADFDFYQNYVDFRVNAISPIADGAFSHYTYKLESSFYDGNKNLVNKISVTPKNTSEPTFNGYLYIVENTWQLYAVSLSITGKQIQQDLLNVVKINQSFAYNNSEDIWYKNSQTLDFDAGIFGAKLTGRFSYVYSNYNFKPDFKNSDFTNEELTFDAEANKKDNSYWAETRPIPLTTEEKYDYKVKDSIEQVINTKPYLDSLDRTNNKFKWFSPVIGYNYNNTYKHQTYSYTGIIRKLGFNTVQAYAFAPSFYFTQRNPDKLTYTTVGTDLNYGFAEKRFRATGTVSRKFNNFTNPILTVTGGSTIEQFNQEKPINRIVNSISTLFFRDNYMKLYDNQFFRLSYQQEPINGIYFLGSIEYTQRRALYNNTDFSTLKNIYHPYTSNNPLLPWDYDTPAFLKHNMYKADISLSYFPGQKYQLRPNGKYDVDETHLPKLYLKYEKGFASSISNYNFDHLAARLTYDVTFGDKGTLGSSFRAGTFFNTGNNIAFTDYRHFNGNQTYVGNKERYLNVFNLLPYYTHSTNDKYFEAHLEHNFNGYLTNQVPLLKELDYHLVAGYHLLTIPGHNPYMEFTAGFDNFGWGKFRLLRVDYIRSYEGGFQSQGVIFGITFLDILEY